MDLLGAIMQYIMHEVVAEGMESPALLEKFKDIAQQEVKHLRKFADDANYLGGVPNMKPAPVEVGAAIAEILKTTLTGSLITESIFANYTFV